MIDPLMFVVICAVKVDICVLLSSCANAHITIGTQSNADFGELSFVRYAHVFQGVYVCVCVNVNNCQVFESNC